MKVDTFGGTVHVEWDPDAAATPLGHLAFFAEYLKVSGRFDALVADCPLHYTSPNAPSKRDVLGTVLLSVLAGQWRYAHITALRGDGVNPSLLGMTKVASEDSVRRGLERIGAEDGASWLHGHLDDTVRPLLSGPWVLDCDTTIKPLYGHQEGAVVSYNPRKPGRPSHAYHAFLMAGTRLVLDVDVAPGNRHRSKSAAPSLWALLGRLGREHRPRLVRGDKDWGSEANMASCVRCLKPPRTCRPQPRTERPLESCRRRTTDPCAPSSVGFAASVRKPVRGGANRPPPWHLVDDGQVFRGFLSVSTRNQVEGNPLSLVESGQASPLNGADVHECVL